MDFNGNSMDFNGFQWISIDFHRISIDFNEFESIPLNLYEFQWISLISIDFNMEFIENLTSCYSNRLHVLQTQCNVKMVEACAHRDVALAARRASARYPNAFDYTKIMIFGGVRDVAGSTSRGSALSQHI